MMHVVLFEVQRVSRFVCAVQLVNVPQFHVVCGNSMKLNHSQQQPSRCSLIDPRFPNGRMRTVQSNPMWLRQDGELRSCICLRVDGTGLFQWSLTDN